MHDSSKFLMLKAFDAFKLLTDNQLNELLSETNFVKSKKHNRIYNDNSQIEYVYFLNKGCIKIAQQTNADHIIIKTIAQPGEFFGHHIFKPAARRNEFAEALETVEFFEIKKESFLKLVKINPDFCQYILQSITASVMALENRIESFLFKKAAQRIKGYLKKLADTEGIKIGLDEILIHPKLSHREIAYITETSRQTVSRVLGELKEANTIFYSQRRSDKILIRNLAALA